MIWDVLYNHEQRIVNAESVVGPGDDPIIQENMGITLGFDGSIGQPQPQPEGPKPGHYFDTLHKVISYVKDKTGMYTRELVVESVPGFPAGPNVVWTKEYFAGGYTPRGEKVLDILENGEFILEPPTVSHIDKWTSGGFQIIGKHDDGFYILSRYPHPIEGDVPDSIVNGSWLYGAYGKIYEWVETYDGLKYIDKVWSEENTQESRDIYPPL
jgi:hypothetical protein